MNVRQETNQWCDWRCLLFIRCRGLFKYLVFLSISFVQVFCAQPSRKTIQNTERINKEEWDREATRYKATYPGFELCLCDESNMSLNIQFSKDMWDHNEKSICNLQNKNTLRILYWNMISKTRIFKLESRDSGFYFVHKNREWVDSANTPAYQKIHKEEINIQDAEAESLFTLVESIDFDQVNIKQDNNKVCYDGNRWIIEIMNNRMYKHIEIGCRYTSETTKLGNELNKIFKLPFEIR